MQDLRRIIWLASFPKSGNTWMRALLGNYLLPEPPDINSLNRFSTADVRQDFFDRAAGRRFRANNMDDWLRMRAKVLPAIAASKPGHHFVKTHSKVAIVRGHHLIMPQVTAAAIYVLRNPFDVLPSWSRHMSLPLDEVIDRMTNPDSMTTSPTGIIEVLGRWDDHATSWIDAPGLAPLIIRYEDLLSDTEAEIRRLFAALGVPVDEAQLARAVEAASFDSLRQQEKQKGFKERPTGMKAFFATGQAGGWRNALSAEQVARVRAAFLPVLERFYPEMLDEIDSFTGSAA